MRGLLWLAIGSAIFIGITFLEQYPILGWLGGFASIAVWIWLTRQLLSDSEFDVIGSGVGTAWAAMIGAVTGLVGAFSAWLAQTGNLLGFTTPPGDRFGAAFGFVGASLGIVYWPIVGAILCAVTAVAITSRRVRSL